MLVKFRLTMTVVFSSVLSFLIAQTGPVNWLAILILSSGGFLVTGAANALNQALEKDYDKLMKRTADRPLAAGRMSMSEAVMAAGFMSLFGITLLALFNPWAAFFGTLALVTYAFLYTPMKRLSPSAVAIGAVPGALPMLIGCVAAQGEITFLGLSLFALQFLWQFPHFWSIGWLGYEDYSNAGYKLMPTNRKGERDRRIGLQAFLYALFLVPVGLIPYLLGVSGWISAVVVVGVSLGYAYFGWNFFKAGSRKSALQLMFFSFAYIPVVLVALLADKI
ncbi:MAG: heme o synthase [Phaeodactylibacter sp.]|nr:heme o synthase [Phaeodactylibacter sp.]MCB9264307.1 protoheme IX farnesyltransferase [Lewinellaceae bacterium]MCB9290801.1 protoheme IX farnesyltransferase [Lewinellaceae bacterium]